MLVRSLLLALLAGLLLGGCANDGQQTPPASSSSDDTARTIPFDPEGTLAVLQGRDTTVTLTIEIAETDSARTRGLMERTSLPERSGMLFPFPEERTQSFWMANTPLPLDIIYINSDSQIVDIAKYTQPFSSKNITSDAPAQYVLEVSAGVADSYGILVGDAVRWTRTEPTQTP
ncbi:DUF192 domain-containing protein [Salisaeta longa]|uniref:DUF192 domain-containing protein n=1 Tax=Salisaeta longa TaxID=503170 RepID=UPI0003B51121|nr:DUF192 domain-containing protein [Salisaeta longa]